MATTVVTRSECDRCGRVEERDGVELGIPPVSWSNASLLRRDAGAGWMNSAATNATLCRRCAEDVRVFILTAPEPR